MIRQHIPDQGHIRTARMGAVSISAVRSIRRVCSTIVIPRVSDGVGATFRVSSACIRVPVDNNACAARRHRVENRQSVDIPLRPHMGVTGLHKLLQPFSEIKHVSDYKGLRLGVDGYAWLHRAAASCADELFHGKETTRLVQSIDNRIRMYEHHEIELFFVFDGAPLGMKSEVEKQRREKRKLAAAANRAGRQPSYQKSLSGLEITAHHAAMVIALLKQRQIQYVVAPFEADSQLVWLEKEGLLQGIISEDSDLLVFGAQRLLTKSDTQSGTCVELNSRRFSPQYQDLAQMRALAIVSGCDYCPGIHGLGPVKAGAMVQRLNGCLESILDSLLLDRRASPHFVDTARKANLAFQYQRVWDVNRKALTLLNDPTQAAEKDGSLMDALTDEVIGRQLSRAEAHRIALGIIDPHDFSQELIVSPLIAQYVNRFRPFALPKPKPFSSPLVVSKAINQRLAPSSASQMTIKTYTSPPSHGRKSPFFKGSSRKASHEDNKENVLYSATIADQASGSHPASPEPSLRANRSNSAPLSVPHRPVAELAVPVLKKAEPVVSISETPPAPVRESSPSSISLTSCATSFSSPPASPGLDPVDPVSPNSSFTLPETVRPLKRPSEFELPRTRRVAVEEAQEIGAYVSESSDTEELPNRFAFLNKFRFTGSVN